MTPEAKQAYDLVLQIRETETEIEQFQEQKRRLEHQLERLVTGQDANSGTAQLKVVIPHLGHQVRRGRAASETSAKKVIARWINSHPEANFSAEIVAEHTQIHLGTVRTNLSKLVRDGVLEKRSANTYGAIRQEKEAPKEEAS